MKKLGILIMAMVLVAGMSLGAMALNGDTEDDVGVDTIIESAAYVEFEDDTYELIFDEPSENSDYGYDEEGRVFVDIPLNITSNTAVDIEITEDLTTVLADQVGWKDVWPYVDVDEAVVAPHIRLKDQAGEDGKNMDYTVATPEDYELDYPDNFTVSHQQDAGSFDYFVEVENKWLNESDTWWELAPETYEGTITATVSAQ